MKHGISVRKNLRGHGQSRSAVIAYFEMCAWQNQEINPPVKSAVKGKVRHLRVDIAVVGIIHGNGDGIGSLFLRRIQSVGDIHRKRRISSLMASCFGLIDIDLSGQSCCQNFQTDPSAFRKNRGIKIFRIGTFPSVILSLAVHPVDGVPSMRKPDFLPVLPVFCKVPVIIESDGLSHSSFSLF